MADSLIHSTTTASISIQNLASEELLERAMGMFSKTKQDAQPNNPYWHLSYYWKSAKAFLKKNLLSGRYFIRPIKQFAARFGEERPASQYDPQDAVVLKSLSLLFNEHVCPQLSQRCTHLAGHGGQKGAVRQIDEAIKSGKYKYVFRTDIKSYYDSINPDLLMGMLRKYIEDKKILDLLYQYIHRCVHKKGRFKCIDSGIPIGCSLSPIMGALYLDKLDRAMKKLESKGIFYVRFMDDVVILAPNRYKFRAAIRIVNDILEELGLEKHPDKNFIGKLSRGFAALGYHFQEFAGIVGPSKTSVTRFEQRISKRQARYDSGESIQRYVKRWLSWCFGGIGSARNFILHSVDDLVNKINIILEYEYLKHKDFVVDQKIEKKIDKGNSGCQHRLYKNFHPQTLQGFTA